MSLNHPQQQESWNCRFHPTDGFHEVGCPHQSWSKQDLQSALETAKKSHEIMIEATSTERQRGVEFMRNHVRQIIKEMK